MENLRIALEMERRGYILYCRAQKLVSDPQIKSLLEHLARDEAEHFQFFWDLYQNACPTDALQSELPQLEASLAAEAFYPGGLMQAAFSGGLASRIAMYDTAIQAEKESIAYYEKLQRILTPATELSRIVQEERCHLKELLQRRALEAAKSATEKDSL